MSGSCGSLSSCSLKQGYMITLSNRTNTNSTEYLSRVSIGPVGHVGRVDEMSGSCGSLSSCSLKQQ